MKNLPEITIEDFNMPDEEKKIPDDLKEELLKKISEDGFHSIEDAKAKLERFLEKIPTDLKRELLKKISEDGFHTIEDAKAKLEGKIPTKSKEE